MTCWSKDVVTEVALHLPLQSLFRCRSVCKLWRDVIDSPSFRKLHIRSNKGEDDDTVYLQLNSDNFDFGSNSADLKVSVKVVDKEKSLNLNMILPKLMTQPEDIWKCSRSVKGLICLNLSNIMRFFAQPLVICNPFLGQFRILPLSPILTSYNSTSSSSCVISLRDVGIGCDGEFYKVVELVYCRKHCCLHAHLYSRRTNSWRELGDQPLRITAPIESSCSDGHFAQWFGKSSSGCIVLTFDMKNEVFRTTRFSDFENSEVEWIVARDNGCSFIRITLYDNIDDLARIYGSWRCEEEGISKLSWNHVVDLEDPDVLPSLTHLPLWRRDRVMLKFFDGKRRAQVCFYDCVARRFIGCIQLPACSDFFDFFDYKGTFISP